MNIVTRIQDPDEVISWWSNLIKTDAESDYIGDYVLTAGYYVSGGAYNEQGSEKYPGTGNGIIFTSIVKLI